MKNMYLPKQDMVGEVQQSYEFLDVHDLDSAPIRCFGVVAIFA